MTHDRETMPGFAFDRVRKGLDMPGLFVVDDAAPAGRCIEELWLAIRCSEPEEWKNLVTYFPL